MERQKARWRKSEDGPDFEKIVTFYVASRLHGQFFYVAIFICHIKTNTPAFQQMQWSHKNWSFLIIYTGKQKLPHKNCHIKIARVDGA